MRRSLLLMFFLGSVFLLRSQNMLDTRLNVQFEHVSLLHALNQLMDEHDLPLSFSDNLIPDRLIQRTYQNSQLRTILDQLLAETDLEYKLRGTVIVLSQLENKPSRKYTISGFLEDVDSGERLVGATILNQLSGHGTVSNDYGFFSIQLEAGRVDLVFSYLGYEPRKISISVEEDIQFNLPLRPSLTLQEVLVLATDTIINSSVSRLGLDPKALQDMPRLGGEADLLRMAYLMPGVQTGTDGVEGMHVRGGGSGQNLVLIDGVPVYYVSHAAGVFSIFNADAIRSANLITGGFPAKYGGRLSSVLDVRTKEGNSKKLVGSAEAGLISGRLSLEGPIIKDKSSFFITGRWSFLNWYVVPFSRRKKTELGETGGLFYDFNDMNAKLNFSLGRKDKLYFSYYQGKDMFLNEGRSVDSVVVRNQGGKIQKYRTFSGYFEQLAWKNKVGVVRWNHIFNDRLFSNVSATYSELSVRSQYQTVDSIVHIATGQFVSPFLAADFQSNIRDAGIRADFDYYPNNRHKISFGGSGNFRYFNPGALLLDNGLGDALIDRRAKQVSVLNQEYIAFIDDEIKLGNGWQLYGGLHLSLNVVEKEHYFSAQPRLGIYGKLTSRLGIRASLSRMSQFIHLLSNSNLGLPTDLWVPSTKDIRPENAWQTTLGFDYKSNKFWTFSLEGYYKKMDHLAAFTEGANYLYDWRNNVAIGEGTSQGVELMIRKKMNRFSGWLAYTISFTDRKFDRINFGEKFPFKFDRRHDFKLVFNYKFNKRFNLSANWLMSSGFTYSLPEAQYRLNVPGDFAPPQGVIVPTFGDKNDDRMPTYHRLDIGCNYNFGTDKIKHQLHFGIYNLYNRRNPLYYSYRTDYVNAGFELRQRQHYVQVRLLPVLPSLSYSIRFF